MHRRHDSPSELLDSLLACLDGSSGQVTTEGMPRPQRHGQEDHGATLHTHSQEGHIR